MPDAALGAPSTRPTRSLHRVGFVGITTHRGRAPSMMAPMDGGTAQSQELKNVEKEDAAHQKRNWVRLTFDCNDRCVFCLDAHTHDGTNRSRDEVKAQILDGRRKGAERLILSGGEPTIHPDYVQFIKLGRMAGYKKIQTVTNGRLFAYK
jgi:uncharacterized radical SAM superfamily Fe-S cluster-containing enzyme